MRWTSLSLKRLRDERASAAAFAVLVLVTALLAAAGPRALSRVGDDTLRADLATHPVAPRSIQLIREDRSPADDPDPLDGVNEVDRQLYATIPAEIRAVIAERATVIDSPRWRVTKRLNDPTTLRFRIQPGAESRVHLVAGRMPTARGDETSSHTLEIAIAVSSAKSLAASIGAAVPLTIDGSDSLASGSGGGTASATIVGLFEVNDPLDPWWLGDPGLVGPITRLLRGDAVFIDTMALLAPDELQGLLDITAGSEETAVFPVPLRMTFREYVDPALIRAGDLVALIPAFRKLGSLYPDANVRGEGNTAMRTALRGYLESFGARWAAALRIVSIAAVGPAAIALAALALASILAAQRRRAALSLARGRGATLAQVTRAVVAEGVLLGTWPAIVGALAAVALTPGDGPNGALLVGLGVAAIAVLILVIATVPAIRVAALGGGREAIRAAPPTPRRLVFEGLVVVLAVAGTVLLRQRGINAASSAGALTVVDPFVAAVPALAGIAAGLAAVRLVPFLVAPLARVAHRARGLVPLLAFRRAAGGGTAAILLVLLATSTIGAFSIAALVNLDRAAEAVTWRSVGADYQVTAADVPLRSHYDFGAIPGVEAAATMFRGRAALETRDASPDFAAIDLSKYELVVSGTTGEAGLPTALFGPAVEPLPILVSDSLAGRSGGIKVGDTLTVRVEGYPFQAHAVGSVASFPGLPDTTFFILANLDQLRELHPGAQLQASVAFLRAPRSAEPDIEAAVAAGMPSATVANRSEVADGLRGAPVVAAIRLAVGAAAAVAALYASLAVAAALALGGSARAIELAHLRTLGLADGQALGVLLAEHLPAIIVAFAGGLGLGAGLYVALAPSLGLDALVGATIEIEPSFDLSLLAVTAGGVIAVVALGLGLGILLGRSTSPVAALRRGFE